MEELDINSVRRIEDPVERARVAGELGARHTSLGNVLYRIRREALLHMRNKLGMKNALISELTGFTPQRVSQLLNTGMPVEGAFLGDGPITVVMARKPGADQRGSGRLVAQEDHTAYAQLATLATDMRMDIHSEVVDPPCIVNLNRPNLIVMTGPRLASNINDILNRDPYIRFEQDDKGWHLIDIETGTVYRSPMDVGKNTDFAWFGRILRPDRQGTFLCLTGIHAMGESGVVHLLINELPDLYAEVGLKPFSSIVSCRFDEATLKVTNSQRVTSLYGSEK
jgi:hypothetical protein